MCISNNVPYVATVGLEVETHGRNLAGDGVGRAGLGSDIDDNGRAGTRRTPACAPAACRGSDTACRRRSPGRCQGDRAARCARTSGGEDATRCPDRSAGSRPGSSGCPATACLAGSAAGAEPRRRGPATAAPWIEAGCRGSAISGFRLDAGRRRLGGIARSGPPPRPTANRAAGLRPRAPRPWRASSVISRAAGSRSRGIRAIASSSSGNASDARTRPPSSSTCSSPSSTEASSRSS